jgi:ribose/xylose/arabinose/galactoside ABC-type transport system permease subunit
MSVSATAENTTSTTERSGGRGAAHIARAFRDRYATLIGFAVMIAIFWGMEPDSFGSWENFRSILTQAAPTVILAVGLTVVLTTAAYDLSFPGIISISSVGGVMLMSDGGASTGVSILATLAIGVAAGVVAGVLVATERASSFIVTLALGTVWTGMAIGISDGRTITDVNLSYIDLTLNEVLGIPNAVIVALVVSLIAWWLLRFTVFGREAQAIGSNPTAARLAGIRINLVRVGAFVVLGVCVAIASILLSSSTGGFNPGLGNGLFIPPFVAAFFGIAVLGAGRFNVFGTVIGALFIGTLETGLIINGTEAWVGDVIVGLVLVVILVVAVGRRTE